MILFEKNKLFKLIAILLLPSFLAAQTTVVVVDSVATDPVPVVQDTLDFNKDPQIETLGQKDETQQVEAQPLEKEVVEPLLIIPEKINVAVLGITGSAKSFSKEDLGAITTRFETELMKTGVFQILERRDMGAILEEQGFQQSGACDNSECQVEMGQLLGVEQIINGSVTQVNDIITLNVKMVDVATGKNLMSHALDIEGDLDLVLRGGCWEVAQVVSGKKEATSSHTVLEAQSSSIIPWIVGGVVVIALTVTAVIFLSQDDSSRSSPPSDGGSPSVNPQ